jgi:hypothetical protein
MSSCALHAPNGAEDGNLVGEEDRAGDGGIRGGLEVNHAALGKLAAIYK